MVCCVVCYLVRRVWCRAMWCVVCLIRVLRVWHGVLRVLDGVLHHGVLRGVLHGVLHGVLRGVLRDVLRGVFSVLHVLRCMLHEVRGSTPHGVPQGSLHGCAAVTAASRPGTGA